MEDTMMFLATCAIVGYCHNIVVKLAKIIALLEQAKKE